MWKHLIDKGFSSGMSPRWVDGAADRVWSQKHQQNVQLLEISTKISSNVKYYYCYYNWNVFIDLSKIIHYKINRCFFFISESNLE